MCVLPICFINRRRPPIRIELSRSILSASEISCLCAPKQHLAEYCEERWPIVKIAYEIGDRIETVNLRRVVRVTPTDGAGVLERRVTEETQSFLRTAKEPTVECHWKPKQAAT